MLETIFERVIGHEGRYTDNPKDPGNWTGGKVGVGELKGTKWGLAAASYPHLDIESLTIETAYTEYSKWYQELRLHELPKVIQYQMFDAAFNHGMRRANKLLQSAVGAEVDGIVGRKTMAAVYACDEEDMVLRFLSERLEFFTNLEHFDEFGRGWSRRIAMNMKYAAEDN